MLEGVRAEVDRTLSILWNKWKYARNESIL